MYLATVKLGSKGYLQTARIFGVSHLLHEAFLSMRLVLFLAKR
jgi:hypothetical protein